VLRVAEPAVQAPDGAAPPHTGWPTRSRADTRPGSSPLLLALVIVAHGAAGLALVGRLETPPAPLPVALVEVQWLPAETAPAPAALPAPAPPVSAPEPAPVAPPPAAPDPVPVEAPPAAPRPAPILVGRPKTQRPVRAAPPKAVKPPAPRPQPPVQRPPRESPPPGPRTADPGPRAPAATTGADPRAAPPARPPAAKPAAGPASPPGFNAAYLHNPAPAYPEEARRRGEEGRVLLRVQVSPAGLPERVQVQSGSGSRTLDRVALAAVQRWRFVPARRGGVAVAGTVLVPLSFSLRR